MAHPLYDLLRRLEEAHIHFRLSRHREDSILVSLTLVGERVEVDVFENGSMEVSRFPGSEAVVGDHRLVHEIIKCQED